MKRVFSGIQPSGIIHIGNYFGAIKNWVDIQNDYECIFCAVDLHAITLPQNPKELLENTYKIISLYLACGINPKNILFIQSQVSAHAELTWILNTITYMGELSRMTQYKEKSSVEKSESVGVGLFDYPVLMAADILLYQTDLVPVGKDQKQHVEIARTIAKRFNNRFGNTFKIPEPLIKKEGCCIMALDEPEKKMSKSAKSEYNYISLLDKPEIIRKKISKAVTDSQTGIVFDPKRKGLYNLLTIYQLFSEVAPPQIEAKFAGKGYGDFKKALAELIIEKLAPIQEKYHKLIADKSYLNKILADGKTKASKIAEKTLRNVKEKVGFIL